MKKFFKRLAITLALLIFLVIAAIGVVVWLVFTPARLTPIVRTQAAKYITCQSKIGEVELTFFSTFPHFGLKVNNFALVNPTGHSSSDTLISVGELVGVVDVEAYWKRNEIVLNKLHLSDGTVNVFVDSLGHANYNVMKVDTTAVVDTSQSAMKFSLINIADVSLKNINLSYDDQPMRMQAGVRNLTAQLSGSLVSDTVLSHVKVSDGLVSFSYAGESYLDRAAVKLNLPIKVILSKQHIQLTDAELSVNDLAVELTGSVENDTINKRVVTDIGYEFKSWSIPTLLALVPPSFRSYLVFDADGEISSNGTVKGIYSSTSMPLMDIHFQLKDGSLKNNSFHLPLSHINGDVAFYSDMKNDAISYVRINNFSAKTPHSSISTRGTITHLFSDMHVDLASDANLTLDEFSPLVPKSMKVRMAGKVSGKIKSRFTMSQMKKMLLDRMNLSVSVEFADFDVAYDSLAMKTNYAKVDFALPNPNPTSANTRFVYAKISTKSLEASKLKAYRVFFQNANIELATSDVRDTTRIPDVACTFSLDTLSASNDTMKLALQKPAGQFTMMPRKGKKMEPKIVITYDGGSMLASMGETIASAKKLQFKADVTNDQSQKDIFLQWLTTGFLNMDNGVVILPTMNQPFQIPSLKMDFNPEVFHIEDSRLKIAHSDFSLTGTLSNILSYFRSDSLLRGDFTFVSSTTDVLQLMGLTSGMGDRTAKSAHETSSESSGPYMVPKGMDMVLHTDIKNATIGTDTIKAIKGDVTVKDGTLLLDGFQFVTPASKMQLTVLYRTPRRNNLFLAMDYNMLSVKIEKLLSMIPDIDTIMPMLKSFRGTGQFHFVGQMNLDSLYNPKKSTILAASSIRGQDLVLMDGTTFSDIAKRLKFNKKTQNKIDSLSAEFTIFKQEIDVYPFLIVMDKYKAVVEGRHNFDLTFDYHISVIDCPLPIRLGLDVSGNIDDLKYKLTKCKYADYFRPTSRHTLANQQLQLRKMIHDALLKNVKPDTGD
ncbi:MAG TPA: AsmA-like C-terminal region-containing protein [Williamwhitmania sp.]|nr:AsmA-like C-terminal region-containing protein [Williamwhitmania sp.]